ncbi:hypothetical protein D3C78_687200 [compost metagenome]
MRMHDATQGETYPQNQPTPRMLLEQAVAVGKLALIQIKVVQLAGLAVQRGQPEEDILDLDPVGTNVLHRRSTDGTGNQTEVLQPRQALGQTPLHERMPGLPCLGFDNYPLPIIGQNTQATTGHTQHQGLHIRSQQQIAAAANDQHRNVMLPGVGQGLTNLGIIVDFGEIPRPDINTECVVRLERYLLLPLTAHRRPLSSMTN